MYRHQYSNTFRERFQKLIWSAPPTHSLSTDNFLLWWQRAKWLFTSYDKPWFNFFDETMKKEKTSYCFRHLFPPSKANTTFYSQISIRIIIKLIIFRRKLFSNYKRNVLKKADVCITFCINFLFDDYSKSRNFYNIQN